MLSDYVERMLLKIGEDLSLARRKRKISIASMADRVGVSKSTIIRMEKGDAGIALSTFMMSTYILGKSDELYKMLDTRKDFRGNDITDSNVPKRIVKIKQKKSF